MTLETFLLDNNKRKIKKDLNKIKNFVFQKMPLKSEKAEWKWVSVNCICGKRLASKYIQNYNTMIKI